LKLSDTETLGFDENSEQQLNEKVRSASVFATVCTAEGDKWQISAVQGNSQTMIPEHSLQAKAGKENMTSVTCFSHTNIRQTASSPCST
jgi:hypothetical protein